MDDGSGIVSLQDLDDKSGVPKSEFTKIPQSGSSSFAFSWNPCTTISSIAACKDSNSCQVDIGGSKYGNYPAGSSDTSFTMDSGGNPVITYKAMITGGHSRSSIITLSCDKTQAVGDFGQGFTENNPDTSTSQYTATLSSKCACAGVCKYSPSYTPEGMASFQDGAGDRTEDNSFMLQVRFTLKEDG
ncbi:hypothetical protein AC249_AIPGENE6962 [Exaiptasia diaphana]|nr:hypothetical protein AC249_AIPGENE6962 [Exaiptasia diaphana]